MARPMWSPAPALTLKPPPPQRPTRSMPSKSVDTALRDILHHIDLAAKFSAGFNLASFKLHIKTGYAVTHCLEITSEASRRFPDTITERHPAIRCKLIAGV